MNLGAERSGVPEISFTRGIFATSMPSSHSSASLIYEVLGRVPGQKPRGNTQCTVTNSTVIHRLRIKRQLIQYDLQGLARVALLDLCNFFGRAGRHDLAAAGTALRA